MKVCFPVGSNEGLGSIVYGHFGSAPAFVVVDADGGGSVSVVNRDLHHAHGSCNPIMAMGGEQVDAVVVGGIGAGALRGLAARGIRVYRAVDGTVADNLNLWKSGRLPELGLDHVCGGHGQGHGCAHT